MSDSKFKYYEVTTTQIIKANSKTDALNKARRRPHVNAEILFTEVDGHRVPAVEAHSVAATA